METYLDGTGYNTYGTGNQYPEVGYWILRGDTKLWILVSQLDTENIYIFQTLYIIYIASFHIKKGVRNYVYMIIWRFCYAVAMKKAKKDVTRDYNDCTHSEISKHRICTFGKKNPIW
jgi:hypothetical protein